MERISQDSEKSSSTYSLIKIIQKFNQIFSLFKNRFGYELKIFGVNKDDSIVNIQRGLINESNEIYWNYLGATHSAIQELPVIPDGMDYKNSYHCIKLTLCSGKSIVFSINSIPNNFPKNILSLDKYFLGLSKYEREEFDRIFLGINKIESNYFNSKGYTESLNGIKKMSTNELLKILNMEISN